MIFGSILVIVLISLIGLAFWRLDCDIYLWILDNLFMSPTSTARLRGQVVWITGASSGIGEFMAYEFARYGCKLALSGTKQAKLDTVKGKCLEFNPALESNDILLVPFNITDFSRHRSCFESVLAHFKRVDILVNNAGRYQRGSFQKIDISVDEELFRINVFGPINLTRLVVDHWYKNNLKGQVAVTSSIAGVLSTPYSCVYSGTKFALQGYFESLRIERSSHVKVTILCPGPVFSQVLESAFGEQPGTTVDLSDHGGPKRMSTERCARLCLTAIVNRVGVAWISNQPALTCCYSTQYLPSLLTFVETRILTEDMIKRVIDGRR